MDTLLEVYDFITDFDLLEEVEIFEKRWFLRWTYITWAYFKNDIFESRIEL